MKIVKSLFEDVPGIRTPMDLPQKRRKRRPEEEFDFRSVAKGKKKKKAGLDKPACVECRKKDKLLARLLKDLECVPPKQRYFDETYLAVRFDISVKTLQAWRDKGNEDLPFYKIGSSVKYRQRDILRFERAAKRKSTSDKGGSNAV